VINTMGRHHLILGKVADYITGKTVVDTHDERARQAIAAFLVEQKGYDKTDLETRADLSVSVDGDSGLVRVDYVVQVQGKAAMVVIYGPGSIVSRQRPTLAVARLLEPYIIPYAVISNGQDAHLMDVRTGKFIGKDMQAIFSKTELLSRIDGAVFEALSEERADKEKRILFCMEVLSKRECEEFTCNI
jgi:type I restriction and modification enzyme subunit R-like protein